MVREIRPELTPFVALNEAEVAAGQKTPWKERYLLIKKHFPSVVTLEWRRAFSDVDLWGRLINDIYERDQRENGTTLDPMQARERLRQLAGTDFSYDPFPIAFRTLAGTRSVSHLANKLDMSRHMVWRLKKDFRTLDLSTIERVAKSFGKDPSYFMEYRIAYILGAIGDQMESAPEMSIDMYRKFRKKKR